MTASLSSVFFAVDGMGLRSFIARIPRDTTRYRASRQGRGVFRDGDDPAHPLRRGARVSSRSPVVVCPSHIPFSQESQQKIPIDILSHQNELQHDAAAAGSGVAKRRAIAWLILALPSIAALLFVACPSLSLLNLRSGLLKTENFNSTGNALISKDADSSEGHSCAGPPPVFETFGLNDRNVSDCCCTFESLERVNYEDVQPLLKKTVATPFFSHFKIDLCSDCELWRDAPLCIVRDCGVCECEAPPGWASEVEWLPDHVVAGDADGDCGHVDDRVVAAVDSHVTDG
ncbi:hypothetical protein ACHAWF_001506 [Thalassiosira exigua]